MAGADYINTQKQLEKLNEGASDVVEETTGGGVTDPEAYEKFLERLALLNPEAFRVPEQFRLASGGRVGFSEGAGRRGLTPDLMTGLRAGLGALGDMKDREFKFDAQEFMINKYREDGTKPKIIGEGIHEIVTGKHTV